MPFGKFYYPAAAARAEAAPVSIGAGEFIKNLVITAPKTAETVTISGVLLYEDGKPVPDQPVDFQTREEEGEEDGEAVDRDDDLVESGFHRVRMDYSGPPSGRTDARGRFTIRVLKGEKGVVVASEATFPGFYVDCPQMDKLIRELLDARSPGTTTDFVFIKTNEVNIEAAGNQTGIELRFPFTECKKKSN